MKIPAAIFKGLPFKFVSAVSALLVITLVSSALYLYQLQQTQLFQGLDDKVNSIGNFIILISPKAIYSFDITTLDQYTQRITRDADIRFAMIRNAQGVTMTTTAPSRLSLQQMETLIDAGTPPANMGIYQFPIKDNEELLGELIIAVDKTRLLNLTADNFFYLLIIDLAIILFLGLVIFFIFRINVLAPVQQLMRTANKVRDGNFDIRAPVGSGDELGELARCFNQMTHKISTEQENLKLANSNLEREIEQRKAVENQMKLAASVFTYSREGIVITDTKANIIDVNAAFSAISGYSREEAIGKNPRFMQSGKHDDAFYRQMWKHLTRDGYWSGEIWNRRKSGAIVVELLTISAVRDINDEIQHFVALFSDITIQKDHQKQLELIAHYDSLTGLPNRMLLADRLKQAIAQANRRQQAVTVAYLDLDGFKQVNDSHGHDLGDQLLVTVAQRMSDCLRETDTIARLGGDEFIAVLVDSDEQESTRSLECLLQAASQPVKIDSILAQVTVSIGVTSYPQQQEVDADQLVRQADQAMYRAKLEGKNRYYHFDPEEDHNLRGHLEKIEQIRVGLRNHEFKLYYQPKVNLRNGKIYGAEALIRWEHPQQGILQPGYFLPLIEQHPLSVTLGEWVIADALEQLQAWRKQGLDISVSINIGAYHLQKDNFVTRLRELLSEHDPSDVQRLQIEVLETSTLDIVQVSHIMHQCIDMGIDFALDDFGTGYSSLTYLKHLPASVLKIDRSFIRDMLEDPQDLAIVEGVIGLARAFRRDVVAEGLETMEHAEVLLMIGCERAQGYAIAHPMPADDLPGWSSHWSPPDNWNKVDHIHRSDPQLLLAMVEHRSWVSAIKNHLDGHIPLPPELNESRCRFAQWLNDEGKTRYHDHDEYHQIQTLHSDIHLIAKSLLKRDPLKEYDLVESDLITLLDTHEKLLGHMKKLFVVF